MLVAQPANVYPARVNVFAVNVLATSYVWVLLLIVPLPPFALYFTVYVQATQALFDSLYPAAHVFTEHTFDVVFAVHDGVSHADTLALFEHALQLLLPFALVVPAAHAVHALAPAALYDPAAQSVHVVAFAALYLPAAHAVHDGFVTPSAP